MKRYRKYLLFLVLGIVFLASFFWFSPLKKQFQVWRLEELLSDVSTTVKVGGSAYAISNGKLTQAADLDTQLAVLRLGAFYEWNKEDPLFDSPDFDPQGVLKVSQALDNEQEQFLSVIKQKEPLYATSFLKAFAQASLADRKFLQERSDSGAYKLLASQRKAAQEYSGSAQSFVNFDKPDNFEFAMFNTATSQQVVLSDYQKIILNGRALEDETQKRQNCLEGKGECTRPYLQFDKPAETLPGGNTPPSFLRKEVLAKQFHDQADNTTFEGPYRASTQCFGWGDNFSLPEHYFYIAKVPSSKASSSLSYIEPVLATDIFFRKIPQDDRVGGDSALKKLGLLYTLQPSYSPYMCMDTSYMNQVAQLSSFLAVNKPLFNFEIAKLPIPSRALVGKAQKAERELFSSKDPSYGDLRNLGDYYASVYVFIIQHPDSAHGKLKTLQDELLRRYLSIKDTMAYFDQLLASESIFIQRVEKTSQVKQPDLATVFGFVYPFRSSYALVYLPFSPAVWRSGDSLEYMEKKKVIGAVSPSGGYISYTQALNFYPQNIIDSWFTDLNPILDQAIQKEK